MVKPKKGNKCVKTDNKQIKNLIILLPSLIRLVRVKAIEKINNN